MQGMQERQERAWSEATKFKPGELTPEEEKLVCEEGLYALNYIPQRTLEKQADLPRSPRPPAKFDIGSELSERIDGYGYVLFVPLSLFFTWAIADAHGLAIGIFCGVLMFTILELGYRLSKRH